MALVCCFVVIIANNDIGDKKTQPVRTDDESVTTAATKEYKTEEPVEEENEESLIADEDKDSEPKVPSNEEPMVERQLTEKERLAINLYESAQSMLNSSRSDRTKAFQLMVESAKLDYEPAMELVAKQHLFGDDLPIDLSIAKNYLTRLAIKGNPNSQLVGICHSFRCLNCNELFSC